MQTARKGVEKIRELIAACNIPARLNEVNIPREAIPQMAVDALKIQRLLKNNPKLVTEEDAVTIYNQAY